MAGILMIGRVLTNGINLRLNASARSAAQIMFEALFQKARQGITATQI
jgi:hypothetical protein